MLISNSFSFKKHKTNSLCGSFLRARRGTVFREPAPARALLSAAQSQSSHHGQPMHRSRPLAPRSLLRRPPGLFLLMAVPRGDFFVQSPRRQLKSTKTNTTALMHVRSESQVVITTDTCPIDFRALGVSTISLGAVGRVVRLSLLRPGSAGRTDHEKIARSRSCYRHDRGAVLAFSQRARRISGRLWRCW